MSASLRPFTYGGSPWNNDSTDSTYLEIIRGLNETASIRGGPDNPYLGIHGRFPRNRFVDARRIELVGRVIGQGATDAAKASSFRTQVKAIQAMFEVEVTKTMSVDLEDGTTATISARTEAVEFDQLVAWVATVTIVLESIDPEWAITGP